MIMTAPEINEDRVEAGSSSAGQKTRTHGEFCARLQVRRG